MLMMVARLAFVRRNDAQDLLPGSREQVVNQNMYTLTPILVCRSHEGQNTHVRVVHPHKPCGEKSSQ